jgi:hypothetical protein
MDRERLAHYIYSLPERLVRSASAILGGAVYELGEIALPARVRRSRLYDSLVHSTLRFFIEQIGQVERTIPEGQALPDDFLVRRAAGNIVEIAGFAMFRASPVWVLAALADVAGAGRELMHEIAAALQKDGLLEEGQTFDTADQLLDGLERTSGRLAEAVNTPPLNAAALREELRKLREDASTIPHALLPSVELLWKDLNFEAQTQGRSVMELSSVMALTAVRQLPERTRWLSNAAVTSGRRTGELLVGGLLEHYRKTLGEIHEFGYLRYFLREFQPYLRGAASQFSPQRISLTERLFKR